MTFTDVTVQPGTHNRAGSSLKDTLWGGPRKKSSSLVSLKDEERATKPSRNMCFQPKHTDNFSLIRYLWSILGIMCVTSASLNPENSRNEKNKGIR